MPPVRRAPVGCDGTGLEHARRARLAVAQLVGDAAGELALVAVHGDEVLEVLAVPGGARLLLRPTAVGEPPRVMVALSLEVLPRVADAFERVARVLARRAAARSALPAEGER
jgi:hypothetical protein